MPQLEASTYISQLFWLFVCFSILFIFMTTVTVPRIRKIMDLRRERIEGAKQKSYEYDMQAEKLRIQFESILQEAKKKAHEVVVTTINSVGLSSVKRKQDISEMTLARIKTAEDKIAEKKAGAAEDIKKIAADITAASAERLLGQAVNHELIRQCVDEVTEQKVA